MLNGVFAIILSLAALVVSIVSMGRQWRSARNANAVASILKLFEEYRSQELRDARRIVFQMADLNSAPPLLSELPDELKGAIERVSHFFDHVGLLVGHELIPAKPMIAFFGFGCGRLWEKLEPCVLAERRARNVGYYLGYFEMFARLSDRLNADDINRDVIHRAGAGRLGN